MKSGTMLQILRLSKFQDFKVHQGKKIQNLKSLNCFFNMTFQYTIFYLHVFYILHGKFLLELLPRFYHLHKWFMFNFSSKKSNKYSMVMTLIQRSRVAYEVGVFSICLPKLDEAHQKTVLYLQTTNCLL